MKYDTEIEIGDTPIEVVVEYEYEPPCGDGWNEPRYPEQINIYAVEDKHGNEIDWQGKLELFLIEKIMEHVHRQAAEYAADKAEYLYESRMERVWWEK